MRFFPNQQRSPSITVENFRTQISKRSSIGCTHRGEKRTLDQVAGENPVLRIFDEGPSEDHPNSDNTILGIGLDVYSDDLTKSGARRFETVHFPARRRLGISARLEMKEFKIVRVSAGKREINTEQSRSISIFRGSSSTDDDHQNG